jgi:hypothetical protein
VKKEMDFFVLVSLVVRNTILRQMKAGDLYLFIGLTISIFILGKPHLQRPLFKTNIYKRYYLYLYYSVFRHY